MSEVSTHISISAFWSMRDSIALLHPLAIGLAGRMAAGLVRELSRGAHGAAGLQRGATLSAPAAAIEAVSRWVSVPIAAGRWRPVSVPLGLALAAGVLWPLGVRCPVSENRLEPFSSFWAMYPLSP